MASDLTADQPLSSPDLEAAWAAASNGTATPTVLIVCGIGTCAYGKRVGSAAVQLGGWGHILGDKGSAYEIGLRGLKASLYYYDQTGRWPSLGVRLLHALQLNAPTDLTDWVRQAQPPEVAALANTVFAAWNAKDRIAADIVAAAASSLARDGAICARRLVGAKKRVRFVLAGSVLSRQPRFAARVSRLLRQLRPGSSVASLRQAAPARRKPGRVVPEVKPGNVVPIRSRRISPTEQRHPRSRRWDQLPLKSAIRLMLSEDAKLPSKILAHEAAVEKAVRAIIKAFRAGGRLLYVGAGTSGRLGVLDASECPPTFRSPPEMVQGIIAGGAPALSRSVEGAEDDVGAGTRAIEFRGVTQRDVVLGIAASGTTPFVWGALQAARRRRATTILLCFNPWLEIPGDWRPRIVIAPALGPELLTGSTRLKAGTATKLILNILSTLAMVHTGKVISNLMVDLHPANTKLRGRAVGIVQQLTGMDAVQARQALVKHGWVIKKAIAGRGRRRDFRA